MPSGLRRVGIRIRGSEPGSLRWAASGCVGRIRPSERRIHTDGPALLKTTGQDETRYALDRTHGRARSIPQEARQIDCWADGPLFAGRREPSSTYRFHSPPQTRVHTQSDAHSRDYQPGGWRAEDTSRIAPSVYRSARARAVFPVWWVTGLRRISLYSPGSSFGSAGLVDRPLGFVLVLPWRPQTDRERHLSGRYPARGKLPPGPRSTYSAGHLCGRCSCSRLPVRLAGGLLSPDPVLRQLGHGAHLLQAACPISPSHETCLRARAPRIVVRDLRSRGVIAAGVAIVFVARAGSVMTWCITDPGVEGPPPRIGPYRCDQGRGGGGPPRRQHVALLKLRRR